MSSNYCCRQWQGFVPKVQEAIGQELNKVEQKYLARPAQEMLCLIHKYCPVCGESLSKEVSHKPKRVVPSQGVPPTQELIPCPSCKGVGNLGEGEGGRKQFCNTCFGEGKVRPKKKVDAEKLSKMDELRTKIRSKQKE